MKTCSKCNIEKSFTQYYHSKGGDNYQKICKVCWNERNKENAKKGKYWKKQNLKSYAVNARQKYSYKISGVYGIYDGGECLYVGESKRVLHRWADHISYTNNLNSQEAKKNPLYKKLSQHMHFIFGVIEECDNHKEREQHYIQQLKPKYNTKTI